MCIHVLMPDLQYTDFLDWATAEEKKAAWIATGSMDYCGNDDRDLPAAGCKQIEPFRATKPTNAFFWQIFRRYTSRKPWDWEDHGDE